MTHDSSTPRAEVLAALADRQAIQDLLAEYCERLDEYDLDGVAATFTENVVTDYGPGRGGRVVGRAEVRARIAGGQAVFRHTCHQLGQTRITLGPAPDEASGVTYVTAWHERFDDTRDTLRLRYLDRFRRQPYGQWLIAERRIEVMGVEGFPGVEWAWVARRPPVA